MTVVSDCDALEMLGLDQQEDAPELSHISSLIATPASAWATAVVLLL